MIEYLAVPEPTASWLLGKPTLAAALLDVIDHGESLASVADAVYAGGTLRVAVDPTETVLLVWNTDYLAGTGAENWSFICVDFKTGINAYPDIRIEVLERALNVASLRLRGLKLDAAWIHRAHDAGVHTCIAGRGTAARQLSLGYSERDVSHNQVQTHSVAILGPFGDFPSAIRQVSASSLRLDALVATAQVLVADRRRIRVHLPPALEKASNAFRSFSMADDSERAAPALTTRSVVAQRFPTAALYSHSYRNWLQPDSPLTDTQRRLIESFPLDEHPLRIVGPAGSGKTLLMQLLAMRSVQVSNGTGTRTLYIAHNNSMAETVKRRFESLAGLDPELTEIVSHIQTVTLSELARSYLEIDETLLLYRDAHDSKALQRQILAEVIVDLQQQGNERCTGPLYQLWLTETSLREIILTLLAAENSVAIKGHGLRFDRQRYVGSQKALSRLHGVLRQEDREFVFEVFSKYQETLEHVYQALDSDDLALTLLSRLRSPLWNLKRRTEGFDYVFIDEVQLFNENERRIFPLLARPRPSHTPLALALDDAQDVYGYSFSGLATLGIGEIQNESLPSIHRSTRAIVDLAMHVIGSSTDLFTVDFPDFTKAVETTVMENHELSAQPALHYCRGTSLADGTVRTVRGLRRAGLKSIAVVVHAVQYEIGILEALRDAGLPLHILKDRGERLDGRGPLVVFARPDAIGGQEFDGVVIAGLEHGVSPPRIAFNEPLESAVEQQHLRETYLSISRARFRVVFLVAGTRDPSAILASARAANLLAVVPLPGE